MSVIADILNMIDKEHSIVLTEDIGLLGNNDFDVSETFGELRAVCDNYPDVKLGEYFSVVTSDAVLLLDDYVTASGIIFKQDGEYAYIFILRDKYVIDDTWSILGDNLADKSPAVVYYDNNELYTNSKELQDKYKYNDSLVCSAFNDRILSLSIDGTKYSVKTLSMKNSIYSFSVYKKI